MIIIAPIALLSCNYFSNKKGIEGNVYTCPMPEDSVISNKPGHCPKCGMPLVLASAVEEGNGQEEEQGQYTCPMQEDSVFSNKPGNCPKCGMKLVEIATATQGNEGLDLDALLKPANEFVVSSIPVTTLSTLELPVEWEATGRVEYDTRAIASVASSVAGRIEKLYVRYRFQKVHKGQKLLDLYSPELLTAQQDLLFLLRNDPENLPFIQAAKEKLLLLGMTGNQLQQLLSSQKPMMTISIYSPYNGHVHESSGMADGTGRGPAGMENTSAFVTGELPLKEGMYLQKGQNIITINNPSKAWALLNVFGEDLPMVKTGQRVRVVPETAPTKDFRATIGFVEPFYRSGSKSVTVRVYFDNSNLKIPIGSQVKATVFGDYIKAQWLPSEAVLSLGLDKVVFVKTEGGFYPRKVETGSEQKGFVKVRSGLLATDSVASNAQYLMDSEGFIKVKGS